MKKRIFAVICAGCMLIIMLSGCTFSAYSSSSLPNPKNTVAQFVDAMRRRDFEAADSLVGNYSDMGFVSFDEVPEDDIDRRLINMLFDSYQVEFYDSDTSPIEIPFESADMTVQGRDAELTFRFRYLCFDMMSEDFAAEITELGESRMFYGEVYDTAEKALALADEAFANVFSEDDMEKYYQKKVFTLTAHYSADGWLLDMSSDFYSALLGK